MDKLDVILWAIGGGFLIILGCFKIIWNEMKDMRNEMKDMRKDIQDIRTSLNRMEGAFYNKDCCMLKNNKQNEKAE